MLTPLEPDEIKIVMETRQIWWDELKSDPTKSEELAIFESLYVKDGKLIEVRYYGF